VDLSEKLSCLPARSPGMLATHDRLNKRKYLKDN
jgi:hypothetical protein